MVHSRTPWHDWKGSCTTVFNKWAWLHIILLIIQHAFACSLSVGVWFFLSKFEYVYWQLTASIFPSGYKMAEFQTFAVTLNKMKWFWQKIQTCTQPLWDQLSDTCMIPNNCSLFVPEVQTNGCFHHGVRSLPAVLAVACWACMLQPVCSELCQLHHRVDHGLSCRVQG